MPDSSYKFLIYHAERKKAIGFPFFRENRHTEKNAKIADTIEIHTLFRQKTGLMDEYFFKVENIDWQSRHFRYIVKDAVFFLKSLFSIKTHETTCVGPLSRRRILFLRAANHDNLG